MTYPDLIKMLDSPILDVTFMITTFIAAMLLLAAGFLLLIVRNQRKKWLLQKEMSSLKESQQNQLIESAVRSEEGERHRIAEMLHDEVGALLSSSKIFLMEIKTENLSEEDKGDHAKVKEMLDEAIQQVRSISHNLHSTILKEFGLNEAIRHFMKKIAGGSAITSTIELDDEYKISNAETDLAVYRIIQELANNIIKYGHPKQIEIRSDLAGNQLNFTIHHNGDGLSQEEFEKLRFQKAGLGLKNIQNRIILLKGDIKFQKNNNRDSTIYLTIPIVT